MIANRNIHFKIKDSIGNTGLLSVLKTAFICSRECPASTILKIYDWAIAQRESNQCVISGFQSKLERDVLHYLLKGKQPIVVALARGLKTRIEPELKKPLGNGRLLIVTPFSNDVNRVTEKRAAIRNQMMIELAEQVVVGHAAENGQLHNILETYPSKVKFL